MTRRLKLAAMAVLGFVTALALAELIGACSRGDPGSDVEGALAQGSRFEQEQRYHEASSLYGGLLAGTLDDGTRAEVRYRLARVLILGKDLGGALAQLQDLVDEDVARFQLDVGALYLQLGDAYLEKGDRKKAQLAWQYGRGVSPARIVEFNRRLDQLIEKH